jgi:hypothetical protein
MSAKHVADAGSYGEDAQCFVRGQGFAELKCAAVSLMLPQRPRKQGATCRIDRLSHQRISGRAMGAAGYPRTTFGTHLARWPGGVKTRRLWPIHVARRIRGALKIFWAALVGNFDE